MSPSLYTVIFLVTDGIFHQFIGLIQVHTQLNHGMCSKS